MDEQLSAVRYKIFRQMLWNGITGHMGGSSILRFFFDEHLH